MREYEFSSLWENVEFVIYCMLAFFVPFFMGHPQIFVGSVVNAALVLAALNMRGWKMLPIIMLPSIGVICAGVIFGGLAASAFLLAPLIWIANALFVLAIKKMVFERKNSGVLAVVWGTALKSAFLFCAASALVWLSILPIAVLGAMGLLQIYTALIGGIGALFVQTAKKQFA